MTIVNNVTRLLIAKKILHKTFELPTDKLGALETARILMVSPDIVYKTIVVKRERGKSILAVVPGPSEVDLKALAQFLGEKKVFLATEAEAERITSLQAGGISPLALIDKGFQVVIDAAAQELEEIHISGGQRGLNIRLPVKALAALTHAHFAVIRSL